METLCDVYEFGGIGPLVYRAGEERGETIVVPDKILIELFDGFSSFAITEMSSTSSLRGAIIGRLDKHDSWSTTGSF